MKSEVADPVELFDGVVEFVELPQPGNAMEQDMDAPFKKVFQEKERDKLQPERLLAKEVLRFCETNGWSCPGREIRRDVRHQDASVVSVEEKPDQILEELATYHLLLLSPRPEAFQD